MARFRAPADRENQAPLASACRPSTSSNSACFRGRRPEASPSTVEAWRPSGSIVFKAATAAASLNACRPAAASRRGRGVEFRQSLFQPSHGLLPVVAGRGPAGASSESPASGGRRNRRRCVGQVFLQRLDQGQRQPAVDARPVRRCRRLAGRARLGPQQPTRIAVERQRGPQQPNDNENPAADGPEARTVRVEGGPGRDGLHRLPVERPASPGRHWALPVSRKLDAAASSRRNGRRLRTDATIFMTAERTPAKPRGAPPRPAPSR